MFRLMPRSDRSNVLPSISYPGVSSYPARLV